MMSGVNQESNAVESFEPDAMMVTGLVVGVRVEVASNLGLEYTAYSAFNPEILNVFDKIVAETRAVNVE